MRATPGKIQRHRIGQSRIASCKQKDEEGNNRFQRHIAPASKRICSSGELLTRQSVVANGFFANSRRKHPLVLKTVVGENRNLLNLFTFLIWAGDLVQTSLHCGATCYIRCAMTRRIVSASGEPSSRDILRCRSLVSSRACQPAIGFGGLSLVLLFTGWLAIPNAGGRVPGHTSASPSAR
jgi:hypothetical protein